MEDGLCGREGKGREKGLVWGFMLMGGWGDEENNIEIGRE